MDNQLETFLKNPKHTLAKRLYDSLKGLCQNLKYRNSLFPIDFVSFHDSLVLVKHSLSKQPELLKYLLIHDNETTAKESAYHALEKYGGELYQVVNAGERKLQIFIHNTAILYDPNRIFTKKGLIQEIHQENPKLPPSIQKEAVQVIQSIAKAFLKTMNIQNNSSLSIPSLKSQFQSTQPLVLAIHNSSSTSDLSVDFFPSSFPDSFAVHKNPKQPSKNFFYVISPEAFSFFREKNYNAVLQKEHELCDDGSLSIWMSKNSFDYINIEAQEGELSFQKEMLELALEYWNSFNSNDSLP